MFKRLLKILGGAGSGNFGRSGRPDNHAKVLPSRSGSGEVWAFTSSLERIVEDEEPKSNTFHINPFQSKAQRKWMWATDPAMARRWEEETPKKKRLVKRVKVNEFIDTQIEEAVAVLSVVRTNGGEGSGNFGHAGRPGERGGSAKADNAALPLVDTAFEKGEATPLADILSPQDLDAVDVAFFGAEPMYMSSAGITTMDFEDDALKRYVKSRVDSEGISKMSSWLTQYGYQGLLKKCVQEGETSAESMKDAMAAVSISRAIRRNVSDVDLWRGVDSKYVNAAKGSSLTLDRISSFSTERHVAEEYSRQGGSNTLFHLTGVAHNVDLDQWGLGIPNEGESLVLGDFIVTDVEEYEKEGKKYTVISLNAAPEKEPKANGSASSGNFGHAGRPGQRGGSVSSELSSTATWSKEGGWMTGGRKPLPEHIAKLSPPPGWKKIWFSPDPKADLLLQGVDSKGRVQSRYSDTHNARAAAAKFNRVSAVVSKFDSIRSRFKKESSNDTAACAALISVTGMRPGSEKDTGAESKGYGATTLLAKHVKKDADGVYLEFVPGKKHGETITMRVDDKAVGRMLLDRVSSRKPDEKLFSVSPQALSKYVHSIAGCKTKDLRTAIGTMTAIREIRKIEEPSSFKEYKSQVKAVATAVAAKLGNTPTIALAAYIDPVVFAAWRKPEWSTK